MHWYYQDLVQDCYLSIDIIKIWFRIVICPSVIFFPDIFAAITLIHKQIIAVAGYYACGAFIWQLHYNGKTVKGTSQVKKFQQFYYIPWNLCLWRYCVFTLSVHLSIRPCFSSVLQFCTSRSLTKWHMQPVQTMIRLLLWEQSDQGLHCLPFH